MSQDDPLPAERGLISVVVAAYDAEATIVGCVESILAQSYRPLELIVVDDGSTDATVELLERHPARKRFEILQLENGGPSRARNRGVASTRGEWVAFFDSDCMLEEDCLELLARGLEDATVASIGGRQLSPDDESRFGLDVAGSFEAIGFLTGYLQSGRGGEIVETAHNPSCIVLYRRSAFVAVGGFDEGLWPGEDVDLDHRLQRAGWRHLFHPRAAIRHYRPSDLGGLRRMMRSYGRAQLLLLKRYGPFRTLHFLALGGVAVAVAWVGILFWRPVLAGGIALGAFSSAVSGLEALRWRAHQPPRFHALVLETAFAWLVGFMLECLRPRFGREPRLAGDSLDEGT